MYVADSCSEGNYDDTVYSSVKLLGRTLSLTVDLSAAECGCNAAWYLVNMAQNAQPGICDGDHCAYLDTAPSPQASMAA